MRISILAGSNSLGEAVRAEVVGAKAQLPADALRTKPKLRVAQSENSWWTSFAKTNLGMHAFHRTKITGARAPLRTKVARARALRAESKFPVRALRVEPKSRCALRTCDSWGSISPSIFWWTVAENSLAARISAMSRLSGGLCQSHEIEAYLTH